MPQSTAPTLRKKRKSPSRLKGTIAAAAPALLSIATKPGHPGIGSAASVSEWRSRSIHAVAAVRTPAPKSTVSGPALSNVARIAIEPTSARNPLLIATGTSRQSACSMMGDDDRLNPVHDALELRQRSETHIGPRRGHHYKHRRNDEAHAAHHQSLPAASLMDDMKRHLG